MTSSSLCAEFLEFAALELRRSGGGQCLATCEPSSCRGLGHLQELADALAEETGCVAGDLLRGFGTVLFPALVRRYPAFFVGIGSTAELVTRFDAHVGAEVAKLVPELRLPSLRVVGRKGRALEIAYRSADGLTDLAEGLLHGSVRHFTEPLLVDRRAGDVAFALAPRVGSSRRAAPPAPRSRPPPRA